MSTQSQRDAYRRDADRRAGEAGQDEERTLTAAAEVDAEIIRSDDGQMARALVASGFFPSIKSASQAMVKVQAGKELGFGPVASMLGIHVWQQGQGENRRVSIQLSANLIGNLVRRGGYDFRVTEHDETVCAIDFYKGKEQIGTSRFTISDAQRAGLATKEVWKVYPRNMLFAAALRNGAKWFCAEVMLGAPLPVVAETETPDQDVTDMETGEVIEGEAVRVVSAPPEGFAVNWPGFWAECREAGADKPLVHLLFNVPDQNGALAEWAEFKAKTEDKTLAQVVAEMRAAFPHLLAGYKAAKSREFIEKASEQGAGRPLSGRAAKMARDMEEEGENRERNDDCCWIGDPCPEHNPAPEPDPMHETPEELAERIAEEKRLGEQAALEMPDAHGKAHP